MPCPELTLRADVFGDVVHTRVEYISDDHPLQTWGTLTMPIEVFPQFKALIELGCNMLRIDYDQRLRSGNEQWPQQWPSIREVER